MDSSLAATMSSTFLPFHNPPHYLLLPSKTPFHPSSKTLLKPSISAKLSSNHNNTPINRSHKEHPHPFTQTLQTAAKTAVLTAVATLIASKFNQLPVKAQPLTPPSTSTLDDNSSSSSTVDDSSSKVDAEVKPTSSSSPLSHLMETNSEFVDSLWKLLQQNLENGEDEEALKILEKLVEAQPMENEWKFLQARLLSEMGRTQEARAVFEAILSVNPLSFEALFENALLMDRCGERDAVIARLEEALSVAMDESKAKEARDVRLIIAQIQFLQKNVDEALKSYEELIKEDGNDFRPYFCKGMIYSLLDRNGEAREQFAKYRELCPKKFEVEGYLRSSISRTKLFGTDS